jgi:hypothetical protein
MINVMNTYDRYVFSAIFATLLQKNADFLENRLFTALISIFESTLPIYTSDNFGVHTMPYMHT